MSPSAIALLRPFLTTVGLALYSAVGLAAGKQNGVTAAVTGWEGKVPYFSPWEPVLPWLCITAAFAAYLAGAAAVRLSRRAVVGLVVVVLTGAGGVAALTQAVEARDRDNAFNYNACVRVKESEYVCEGGDTERRLPGTPEFQWQAQLRSGPPQYPYRPDWEPLWS